MVCYWILKVGEGMKTILEICREVADIVGVTQPTNLFSQLDCKWLELIRNELEYLRDYGEWLDTVRQSYFTIKSGRKRYLINDFAPDFNLLSNYTIFIKDKQERIIKAIIPEKREEYFKIENGYFILKNELPEGAKVIFQYRSTCVAWDYDDFEEKTVLDKNTDVPIFDENLVKLGVLWRYELYKGIDYDEDYSEYGRELIKRFTMD